MAVSLNRVLVTAPGLPPRPRLYLDPMSNRTSFKMRLPNWRSHVAAEQVTNVLQVILVVGFLVLMFTGHGRLLRLETPLALFLYCAVGVAGCVVLASIAKQFMAQIVFAGKLKVCCTTDSVVIASSLYDQPFVIWRNWKNWPIDIRCEQGMDDEARQTLALQRVQRNPLVIGQLEKAVMLCVTFGPSVNKFQMGLGEEGRFMRSIPLCSLDGRNYVLVATVFKAALALTSSRAETSIEHNGGKDIDL